MAKEFYGYFDSTIDDVREYDDSCFAQILRGMARNGVTSHEGGLQATADGLSLETRISPGGCLINGYMYVLEEDGGALKTMIHQPSGAADRYDRVVVRLDLNTEARSMGIFLLSGLPAANPQPPALTRAAMVYEVGLAKVRIRAGATVVEAGDVEDERADEALCGEAAPVWLSRAALDKRYGMPATHTSPGQMSAMDKLAVDGMEGKLNLKLDMQRVTNSLTVAQEGYALDARQGLALHNEIAQKATVRNLSFGLPTAGWSASAPYTQTVMVAGMLDTDTPLVDVMLSNTAATAMKQLEAYGCVGRMDTLAGQIKATCYEDKPTVDLTLVLKAVK